VRFASAADRAAFAEELAAAVTALVAKYQDDSAPAGRPHRVVVSVHPKADGRMSIAVRASERGAEPDREPTISTAVQREEP